MKIVLLFKGLLVTKALCTFSSGPQMKDAHRFTIIERITHICIDNTHFKYQLSTSLRFQSGNNIRVNNTHKSRTYKKKLVFFHIHTLN